MVNQDFIEKQRTRFDFLQKLNEMSDGDTTKQVHGCEVAKALGFENDFSKLKLAVNYLKGENLIADTRIVCGCSLGILTITHQGIKELESAVRNPENPTQHFAPIHVLYQPITLHNPKNTQIGNNNTQTIIVNKQKNHKVFKDIEIAIQENIYDGAEKDELIAKLQSLKDSVGTPNFQQGYKDFITSAANHMTILAPLLPMLTSYLN